MAILVEVEQGGHFKGRMELIKHIKGGKLSPSQAIAAFCYECCGFHDQGRFDCKVESCPLYPLNPARTGGTVKRKTLSEEHRKKLSENLKKRKA
ncbi:hypothetical protein GSbR_21790 [Geobacter sp. SVR]|nr:hypothetical protein GSVR_16030 [Geobacter sp. SVR]GCF85579.1 hypothetical protein GSbR_21790 [Geobacter sp. SVR]